MSTYGIDFRSYHTAFLKKSILELLTELLLLEPSLCYAEFITEWHRHRDDMFNTLHCLSHCVWVSVLESAPASAGLLHPVDQVAQLLTTSQPLLYVRPTATTNACHSYLFSVLCNVILKINSFPFGKNLPPDTSGIWNRPKRASQPRTLRSTARSCNAVPSHVIFTGYCSQMPLCAVGNTWQH